MKHALWIHHVAICFTLIHPAFHLNYKVTQLLIVLKLSFFLNQKDNSIIPTFHQQMFSLNTMTMNCSYYKRSLMHQMTISTIMTFITVNNRILSKDQILVSCSHMTCYLKNYTTYQSIYFIDDFIQGMIKNPKIKEIH